MLMTRMVLMLQEFTLMKEKKFEKAKKGKKLLVSRL
jgi:hypothetical protein